MKKLELKALIKQLEFDRDELRAGLEKWREGYARLVERQQVNNFKARRWQERAEKAEARVAELEADLAAYEDYATRLEASIKLEQKAYLSIGDYWRDKVDGYRADLAAYEQYATELESLLRKSTADNHRIKEKLNELSLEEDWMDKATELEAELAAYKQYATELESAEDDTLRDAAVQALAEYIAACLAREDDEDAKRVRAAINELETVPFERRTDPEPDDDEDVPGKSIDDYTPVGYIDETNHCASCAELFKGYLSRRGVDLGGPDRGATLNPGEFIIPKGKVQEWDLTSTRWASGAVQADRGRCCGGCCD